MKRSSVISTFSWGGKIFFIFGGECHRTIEKLRKKHFICSNLTSFIVRPISSLFSFSLF